MDSETPRAALLSTPVYLAIMTATVVLLLILLITLIWCIKSKGSKKGTASGYRPGRKQTGTGKDFWISHQNGQHIREPGIVSFSKHLFSFYVFVLHMLFWVLNFTRRNLLWMLLAYVLAFVLAFNKTECIDETKVVVNVYVMPALFHWE